MAHIDVWSIVEAAARIRSGAGISSEGFASKKEHYQGDQGQSR
jgi:hypothetical protein